MFTSTRNGVGFTDNMPNRRRASSPQPHGRRPSNFDEWSGPMCYMRCTIAPRRFQDWSLWSSSERNSVKYLPPVVNKAVKRYLLSASGNLQLWLPRRGGSSSRQAGTQRRCSRPLLRQQPAAATKIKTAAAKMETSAPSSSGAPQTRRPGARQYRVRAERHLGAWEEVRASRYEPTG